MQLAFRLGKTPVRVQASFLVMCVIFALNRFDGGNPALGLEWVAVVFVSVLWHEMGHALMGRAFGLAPQIDLHGMGGTTSWMQGRNVSNGRSVLISLAGPFAGIAIGVLVFVVFLFTPPLEGEIARSAVSDFIWVNCGWGVMNLVPMLPLDGGNVMRSALDGVTKGKGERAARIISMVIAVAVVAYAAYAKNLWIGFLGALFAYQNYRALTAMGGASAAPAAPVTDDQLRPQLDAAYDALKREDGSGVLRLVAPILDVAKSDPLRAEALHLAAYGLLLEGRAKDADQMIAMLPPGYSPHPSYVEARGRFPA